MFNYCFDSCTFNHIPRISIANGADQRTGATKYITQAENGKNQKLHCELGFTQTANSKQAVVNSINNGSKICRFLRTVHSK